MNNKTLQSVLYIALLFEKYMSKCTFDGIYI